jgi:hypothetical protein
VTVITVDGFIHPRHGWIGVPLILDSVFNLRMLVSGYQRTVVSQRTLETLPYLFDRIGPNRYSVRRASLGGEPITGLQVATSRQIERLDADGILGLDFLERFTDINLNLPSRIITFSGS